MKKKGGLNKKGMSEIMTVLAIVMIFYVIMSTFNWMIFIGSEEIADYNSQKIIQSDIKTQEVRAFKVKNICEYSLKMALDQVTKAGGYYVDTMEEKEGSGDIDTYDGFAPFWFYEDGAVFPETVVGTDIGPDMLKNIDKAFTMILQKQIAIPYILFGSDEQPSKQFYIPKTDISNDDADWSTTGAIFDNILSTGTQLELNPVLVPSYDIFDLGSLDSSKWDIVLDENNKISMGSGISWVGSDDLLNNSYQIIEKVPRAVPIGDVVNYKLKLNCDSGNNLADTNPVYFWAAVTDSSETLLKDSVSEKYGYSWGTGDSSNFVYQTNVVCPSDKYLKFEVLRGRYNVFESSDGLTWLAKGGISYPDTDFVKLSFGWVEKSNLTDKYFTSTVNEVDIINSFHGTYESENIIATNPIIFVKVKWDGETHYNLQPNEYEFEYNFLEGTTFPNVLNCTDDNWTNISSSTYSPSPFNNISIAGCTDEILPIVNISLDVLNGKYKVLALLHKDSDALTYTYSYSNPVPDRKVSVSAGLGSEWVDLGEVDVRYGKFFLFIGDISASSTLYGSWDAIQLYPKVSDIKVNVSVNDGATWHEVTNDSIIDTGTDPGVLTNLKYKIDMVSYDVNYIPIIEDIRLEYTENYAETVTLQSLVDVGGGKLIATCASYNGISKELSDTAITNNFLYNITMDTNLPELYNFAKELVEDELDSSSGEQISIVLRKEMELWRDQWQDQWDMTDDNILTCDDAGLTYNTHITSTHLKYRQHCPSLSLLETSDRYLGFPEKQSVCDVIEAQLVEEYSNSLIWLKLIYGNVDNYIKNNLDCTDFSNIITDFSKDFTKAGVNQHVPHYANLEGLQIALDIYAESLSTTDYKVVMEIVPTNFAELGISIDDTEAQSLIKAEEWKASYIKSELFLDYKRPLNVLNCSNSVCCDASIVNTVDSPGCYDDSTFFVTPNYRAFTPRADTNESLQMCWKDNSCCEYPEDINEPNTIKANPNRYSTCYNDNGCCENDYTWDNNLNNIVCWKPNADLPNTCDSDCTIYGSYPGYTADLNKDNCNGIGNCCNYTNTGPSDCCGNTNFCVKPQPFWTNILACDQKVSIHTNCDQTASIRESCTCWQVEDCEMRAFRYYWIDHPIIVYISVTMLREDGYFDNFGHPTDKSIGFYIQVNDGPGAIINESIIGAIPIGAPVDIGGFEAPEVCKYDSFTEVRTSLLSSFLNFVDCFVGDCNLPDNNEYQRCVYFGVLRDSVET
ncbi:MAG: hypothetical protein K0B02_04865 [DPANN group archaeon]|nr:hypothetical protein [DPANN group archaeon]